MAPNSRAQAGFTLLEVLVATMIAGLVFAADLPVTATAMRRIGDDRGELVACERPR